ncbi:MAG: DUF4157 domain-containing protein [Deltaproteobacteria bacterium]|nr:DUF4157 domain-containing protein [Deltaproteobacteria bacterium]
MAYQPRLQRRETGAATPAGTSPHEVAAAGVNGPASQFPHAGALGASYGRAITAQAHFGAEPRAACEALGAEAFAIGDHVAFASESPSLELAGHEAAHTLQQAGGVQLAGGVGQVGDQHEQAADHAASLAARGESAAHLFAAPGTPSASAVVQKKSAGAAAGGPTLQLEESHYFESTGVGREAVAFLPLTNTGATDLHITAVLGDEGHTGDFALDASLPLRVSPGATKSLRGRFKPTAPGKRRASFMIQSDDPKFRVRSISLQGFATPSTAAPAGPTATARQTGALLPDVIDTPRKARTPQQASDLVNGALLLLPKVDYLRALQPSPPREQPAMGGVPSILVGEDGTMQDPVNPAVATSPGSRSSLGAHRAYQDSYGALSSLKEHNKLLREITGGKVVGEGRLSQRERNAVETAQGKESDSAADLGRARGDVQLTENRMQALAMEIAAATKQAEGAHKMFEAIEYRIRVEDLEKTSRQTGKKIEKLKAAQASKLARVKGILAYTGKALKFASKITSKPLEALGEIVEGFGAAYGAGGGDSTEVGHLKAELAALTQEIEAGRDSALQSDLEWARLNFEAGTLIVAAKIALLQGETESRKDQYGQLGQRAGAAVAPRLGSNNRVGVRVRLIPYLEAVLSATAQVDSARLRSNDDPAQISDPADAFYARWMLATLPGIADAVDALRHHCEAELGAGRALMELLDPAP